MTPQKVEKKSLSKSILKMKFMTKSKEKYLKDQDEEMGRAMFASEATEAMLAKGEKFIIEPSYVPCEKLIEGRLSYHGMNPEIERLTHKKKYEKVDEKTDMEVNDMEINDMEMVRRYTTLIGTISNKFKSKKAKSPSTDSPPQKRTKFIKPKDDD